MTAEAPLRAPDVIDLTDAHPRPAVPAARRFTSVTTAPAARTTTSVLLCGVAPVPAHGLVEALRQHGVDGTTARDLAALRDPLDGTTGPAPQVDVVAVPAGTVAAAAGLLQRVAGRAPALVALLDDPAPASYAAALRAGARGAVHTGGPLGGVVAALCAAARGFTVLPGGVARALCLPLVGVRVPEVTTDERSWLRLLAAGVPVSELAARTSYSEREMYRLLGRTYQRLGASNRTEALLIAQRAGLLEA
ncbi:hypothetical protein [Kineococcus gypseus]|uniref:hypothetical protein n=1 Tax=Kineococcus gypseus TaxID=1637102 RepID=UPI003D7E5AF0